ncbi:MAG TPA: SpvB/TcaC N-terminal domain-containing protein [Polyangiaceae bacterium]|nr:SpvB/TcaC N-terminal domain-containing protein [Polyangiaceae bacterium]
MRSEDNVRAPGSGEPSAPQTPGALAPPSLSLPRGGGAIRGIGEKFATNPVTGTGVTSVPIATSPGRSGFDPKLELTYDSGEGNGPFGFGWSLRLPAIVRKTDKGLPRYDDAGESDVFILSGLEDLVPRLDAVGHHRADTTSAPGYVIHAYRPRIEGAFARIERWTRQCDGDVHWRSISSDNVLTVYGATPHARIADPQDHRHVFSWLVCEVRDDKGNAILYEYKPEDGAGVDPGLAHERSRGSPMAPGRTANRYIKRVRYGNRTSLLDAEGRRPALLTDERRANAAWMFELVFDYGEHDREAPRPQEAGTWAFRPDPFSSRRAGFEVRTTRLCRRVLMFHHFPEEAEVGADALVRSTDFSYSHELEPSGASPAAYQFLRAVTHYGYRRVPGGYLRRGVPPVEFFYTEAVIHDAVQRVDPESLENLPRGLDGNVYRWLDLHGEGIPGILSEQAGAWLYKRNLSPISRRPVEFGPAERVAVLPNRTIASGDAQFLDLGGDGQLDLVVLDRETPGFYEHDRAEGWQPFRPFRTMPTRSFADPNLRFIDLDGDGLADLLITEDDVLTWHPSLGESGFGPARSIRKALDEERGPRLLFGDRLETIYLADMTGDGLTDLVRVRNAEVCYWPNLGYGRFGAKIIMDRSPRFDEPDQFEQRRIRLADIDGSGTTDIIYLHRDGARIYLNESGNGWQAPRSLRAWPPADQQTSVAVVDLFGNGTACLVWSSPLPGDAARQMQFVDLMGGKKPHLLSRVVNNLGAETRVEYASSTKFYLQDARAGNPWLTKLAFPVFVVERVEVVDAIAGNRFTTCYAYHHGYFDGVEREFRGFALVEQLDTEQFETLAGAGAPPANNIDPASHVPPVLTKTWFHTGIFLDRNRVSNFFAGLLDPCDDGEYYREPGLNPAQAARALLPDTVLPPRLSLDEEREACRALKGLMLRRETYALDGSERAATPYTVVEQNFEVVRLQAKGSFRHAVFFAHPREALSSQYERNPRDPRVSHALTLEVDEFGNVLRELAVAYARRADALDPALGSEALAEQTRGRISYTERRFTRPVETPDHHRTPLLADTRTWELTGFAPEAASDRFSIEEWRSDDFRRLRASAEIPYEAQADPGVAQKRLIERVITRYRRDDLTALLPVGELEALALSGESYKLAFTPSLLRDVFQRSRPDAPPEDLLPDPAQLLQGRGADQGGYVAIEGNWWLPSGRSFFDPAAESDDPGTAAQELATARRHFFLPRKLVDPFGHATSVKHDRYDLLVHEVVDALGNVVSAANDYRVLQVAEVTDPNGNRAAAAFDTLGLLVATAVRGKADEQVGDLLEGFEPDPALATVQAFLADPLEQAPELLGMATTRVVYDLDRFRRAGQPPVAASLKRERHASDAAAGDGRVQISFTYSDGLGHEIQKKLQAEPGLAPQRDAEKLLGSGDIEPGTLLRGNDGRLAQARAARRWVGSGRTVFDNKGRPIRQYEPFFSATHLYEREREMTDTGVSQIRFHDPLGRLVATLLPNDTYEKVVIEGWKQSAFDANDTVAARGAQTGDPRTDPDIAGFVRRYFDGQPAFQTWYAQRAAGQLGSAERAAALKAAVHAGTPTVSHSDPLARTFLKVAQNRLERDGELIETRHATRIELDIEGNIRSSSDAEGRVVERRDYDILGNVIRRSSMDAGQRWTLNDVAGKAIRTWDSRGFSRRLAYDELRRNTDVFVSEAGAERLAERTVYGEARGSAANHRTRIYQLLDAAGCETRVAYDFKGNLLENRRDLLSGHEQNVDWRAPPGIDGGSFSTRSSYDALNRALTTTTPDGSVYRATFNEANLLDAVQVNVRGAPVATAFVTNIDYDAKGRRQHIAYGNGARTSYTYDPLTFRLTELRTRRRDVSDRSGSPLFADAAVRQELRYTYDPVGNLTQVEDGALATVFRGGQRVDAASHYTYDALYRLVEATGREHSGQTAFDVRPADGSLRDFPFAGARAHANDLQALRNYSERYEYDRAGNLRELRHRAASGRWTRRYDYAEPSPLEHDKPSNRLSRTSIGAGFEFVENYAYDAHGNLLATPQLAELIWDFEDQLQQADLRGGGRARYVYDASGRRVRKIIESADGVRRKERIYLGGFEIYREYSSDGRTLSLERESLHVLDDQRRLALVETQTVAGGNPVTGPRPLLRYQFDNHLGSATLELDAEGALISYEEYHPYGTTSFQVGRNAAEVSAKRYRYIGLERDEETGFAYHSARYYLPWLGRWCSPDPAGTTDSLNLYEYVSGNPMRLVDPSGLSGWDRFLGGVKAVGGALETVAGAGLVAVGVATSEIGIGIPIAAAGVLVTAHGADTVVSGVRTAVSGTEVDSFTSQGLQAAGLSRTQANLADAGIGIVGSLGAGALARAPAAAPTVIRAAAETAEAAPAVARAAPAVAEAAPAAARAVPALAEATPAAARAAPAATEAAAQAAPAAARAAPAPRAAAAAPQAAKAGTAAAAPQAAAAAPQAAAAAPAVAAAPQAAAAAPTVASGGAAVVRVGQAGEAAVRAAYNIGPKVIIRVAGRTRIPDGLTSTVLSEVKNVRSLSYTQQLRDFAAYAAQNGLRFDLFVRPNTILSGPLAQEIANGVINLRFIP